MEDNEVRSEEDGTSEQAHAILVKKQPSGLRFHQVLRCLTVHPGAGSSSFQIATDTFSHATWLQRGKYEGNYCFFFKLSFFLMHAPLVL